MFVDFAKTVYTLKEGTFVVDPRYKVLSSIGRGAQGLICAARDTCAPEPMEGGQEELIIDSPYFTKPQPLKPGPCHPCPLRPARADERVVIGNEKGQPCRR